MPFGINTFDDLPIELYLDGLLQDSVIMADTIPDWVGRFFDHSDTELYQETFMTRAGLGQFSPWNMQSTIGSQRMTTGYETTIVQTAFASGTELTYKMMKYLRYREFNSDSTKFLEWAGRQTRNTQAFAWVMGQLFHTTAPWNAQEGKFIWDYNHPLQNGGFYTNLLTAPLTPTSLRQGLTMQALTPDPQGNLMHSMCKELWVYKGDETNAIETVNQGIEYRPGSANFTTNKAVEREKLVIVACEEIEQGAWILKDAPKRCGLKALTSEALHSERYEWRPTKSVRYVADYAEAYGAKDWRGSVASTGTG